MEKNLQVVVYSGKFDSDQERHCRVTLGKQTFRTGPASGETPDWDANLMLELSDERALRFEVFCQKVLTGYVDIDLRTLASRSKKQFRGNLDLKPNGQIKVKLAMIAAKIAVTPSPTTPEPYAKRDSSSTPEISDKNGRPQCIPAPGSKEDGLLLLAPGLPADSKCLASLWAEMATSKTVTHHPDPDLVKLIQATPDDSTRDPPDKKPSSRHRDGRAAYREAAPGATAGMWGSAEEDRSSRVTHKRESKQSLKSPAGRTAQRHSYVESNPRQREAHSIAIQKDQRQRRRTVAQASSSSGSSC